MSAFNEKELSARFRAEEEEVQRLWNEVLKAAKRVDESEVHTMLYCRENDSMYLDEEDFWEEYSENSDEFDEKPTQLWVSVETNLSSVKNADFDPIFGGSGAVFGEKVYYPAYNQYILIDWDAYEEWRD